MTDAARALQGGLKAPRLVVRLPTHVAVFLGLSTAVYAVSLAGVTALQARSEADLEADHAPVVSSLELIAARNAAIAASLHAAGSDYAAAVQRYEAAGGRLADLQVAIAGLATSVAQINGVATHLPTTVALPKMARASGGGAPPTSATTGASGAR